MITKNTKLRGFLVVLPREFKQFVDLRCFHVKVSLLLRHIFLGSTQIFDIILRSPVYDCYSYGSTINLLQLEIKFSVELESK